MSQSRAPSFLAGTASLLLLCAATARSAEPPDFSGNWQLNHEQSDDAVAKVKDAAGSEYVQGGPSWAAETILPWGRKFSEDERVMLRDVLVGAVRGFEKVEIEQTSSEIKTIHGDEGLRVFYLKRAAAGTNILTGEKVKRTAQWKGDQLLLESAGGKGTSKETLSFAPGGTQLVHSLHIEMDLLKHPIDLRLVYDRLPAAP
jgi:hypothetical protein